MKLFMYLAAILLLASGCNVLQPRVSGSGVAQTEFRQVAPFNEIKLAGIGTVNVVAGQQQSLEVTTDDNLLSRVETEVENGRLKIKTNGNIRPRTGLVVNVAVPELAAAKVSGAGKLNVDGVQGEQLDLSISGAGDLRANGYARSVTTNISGAGSADLKQLVSDCTDVKISGSGHVDLFATESLNARISGAGSVDCYGHPVDVHQHVTGSGSLHLR